MQLLGDAVRVRAGAPRRARSTSSARPRATPAAPPSTRCAASAASSVFMLSPHGRMSPFQQAQMFSLQDANIHNIAIEGVFDDCQDIVKAVSNDLAFKRRTASAPSTRSTGRACWRRSSTTSPATSRPRRANDEAVELRGAVGQLRQHLRRPRRAHDGPADPPPGRWRPTRTTCSTSSSAPAPTACAAPPRRTRRRARRWTSRRRRTSSASSSTCSAATRRARARCSPRSRRGGVFTLDAAERERDRASSASSRAQHARRPPGDDPRHVHERFGEMIDPHTADGLKVGARPRRARRCR